MKWKDIKKTNEYKSLTRTNKMVFKKFFKNANHKQRVTMIKTLEKQISNLLLLKDMMSGYQKTGDCRILEYCIDNFYEGEK